MFLKSTTWITWGAKYKKYILDNDIYHKDNLTGHVHVGFGTGKNIEEAFEDFKKDKKLSDEYEYEILPTSRLKPGTTTRWYLHILRKEKSNK